MKAKLQILGAAGCVTGSCMLLEPELDAQFELETGAQAMAHETAAPNDAARAAMLARVRAALQAPPFAADQTVVAAP